jgi:hypothetical protein
LLDDYSRTYVFCDLALTPTLCVTVRALITAMRQYQVIPNAVLFDNGSGFKGKMLEEFCRRLDIQIIHETPYHPQTNGKLERAFRDDMRDFYQHYATWTLDRLRQDLPTYVEYRNTIRGHWALGGRPASTRLREQHRMAVPWVLEQLETYAEYVIAQRTLPEPGYLRFFNRKAYFDPGFRGLEVTLCVTLDGLEMRHEGHRLALWRDYHACRQLWGRYRYSELPDAFLFESYEEEICPRNTVAY